MTKKSVTDLQLNCTPGQHAFDIWQCIQVKWNTFVFILLQKTIFQCKKCFFTVGKKICIFLAVKKICVFFFHRSKKKKKKFRQKVSQSVGSSYPEKKKHHRFARGDKTKFWCGAKIYAETQIALTEKIYAASETLRVWVWSRQVRLYYRIWIPSFPIFHPNFFLYHQAL